MKKLVGYGTAGEVPRMPQKTLFRSATMPYAPQRLNSSYTPVGRVDVDEIKKTGRHETMKPPVSPLSLHTAHYMAD